ncbi:MAG: glycosyltransferase, partial [Elusimicrobia bacterium]|nr:glycosyltransferase [Elusimicrobiota bacterium]MBD3412620.1 glycosyltransferase [Elusimicrobiota bacterium]
DFFVMPSHYEPCGLGQMIAMRYASIPVVMKTGGLADTVVDYNEDPVRGNGFVFTTYEPVSLLNAMHRAVASWQDPEQRKAIIATMSKADFTWKHSALEYIRLYRKILNQ